MKIRPIDKNSQGEISLVASRMRDTLIEVLGYERGSSMYSLEWLEQRARFHLDPAVCQGEIFVAEVEDKIVGHTIVRIEGGEGQHFGLFSTFYVLPDFRRQSIAEEFINIGEKRMKELGVNEAATDTSLENKKLINLLQKFGYRETFRNDEMLRMSKKL